MAGSGPGRPRRRNRSADVDVSDAGTGADDPGRDRQLANDRLVHDVLRNLFDGPGPEAEPGTASVAVVADADAEADTDRPSVGRARATLDGLRVEMPEEEGAYGPGGGVAVLPTRRSLPGALAGVLSRFVDEAGEMSLLAGMVIKSAVTRPRGYWGEVRDIMYDSIKLCWIPMVISVVGFGFGAPGLQGGNILYIFGVPDRLGGFFMFASIREFAPWIDAMVIAGVVGTAITADLGARRIREEIDAMEVLGVDPIRHLVVPRVIGTALITGFFDLFALVLGVLGGYIASVIFLGSSASGYVASFFTESNITDDWSSLVKTFLFGAIIGVVCCYKGFKAKGGPAGVGRAVNQAVVISFALIWIVNYAFTNIMLGFAPSTQVIK